MISAITTKNLTKKYGSKTVVNDVNLNIKQGEIYGLVGRNGAGKTTIMRMLLGLCNPTSGSSILLDGDRNSGTRVGSIIETPTFYMNESAMTNLMIRAKLIGLKNSKRYIEDALDAVELFDERNDKVKSFSLGMTQRLGIAEALLGEPDLLILDEPINGLDPIAIADVRDCLLDINSDRDTTIFISSHILGELEKLATNYGFISDGKLIKEVTEEEVKAQNIDLEKYFLEMIGVDEDYDQNN